ncbi:hypothetical protein KBX50_05250 [Micromonospora sp. C51]|uniref:hypothetical protein n=1 Tax=Micromonospora sp. C51 TaxID=2824879 RepID=UPI001B3736CF|nr:hypothetical protein [Micromonospora sp. C51]MBQ1047865.1 hypothetical protein [Micromonospora sp. C51]
MNTPQPAEVPTVMEDVVIGWVRPDLVHGDFMDCVLRTIATDREDACRLAGWTQVRSGANVAAARNRLVNWFLDTHADWLLMVDTDMVWTPEDVTTLLAHAHPDAAPIVGGLCFAKEFDSGAVWPTLFEAEDAGGFPRLFRFHSWPPNALYQVDGTGAAFLLVHRTVFETVAARGFSVAYPWFQETENPAGRVSEDLTFCLRARACGYPVHVHTGVQVGHIKTHVVTAGTYLSQRLGVDASEGEQR